MGKGTRNCVRRYDSRGRVCVAGVAVSGPSPTGHGSSEIGRRAVRCAWLVILFLIVGALLLLTPPQATFAQVPSGFEICLDQTCTEGNVSMGEWVTETLSGPGALSFYLKFATDYELGCVWIDFIYSHDGESTSQFWNSDAGVRLLVNKNDYEGTGQLITAVGSSDGRAIDLSSDGNDVFDLAIISPPHPKSLLEANNGMVKVCVTDSDQSRPARIYLNNYDGSYYVGGAEFSMRWWSYNPTPPEAEFCPDGTEVLTNTVVLSPGSPWQKTVETEHSRVKVRYTFSDTMQGGSVIHYVAMNVNETEVTRQFYTDEMQEWDPVTGWPDTPFSFMVPNTDDDEYSDYDPAAYETGPTLDLYASEGYNTLNLLSVCVIQVQTSEFCQNGIEALEASPVYLSAAGGEWTRRLDAEELDGLTHFVVQYRVSHPDWPGTNYPYDEIYGKFMPQIQQNFFYVESPITYGITFTLPISNAFSLVDETLFLRFYNRNDAVLLNSVCIIDATESYLSQLSTENCQLYNPDFVTPPSAADWQTEGGVNHDLLIGTNGGVALSTGQVYQTPVIDVPNVWQMEVRASGNIGDDLVFGTQRPSLLDGGMQLKTETLSAEYQLFRNNIYVTSQDWVAVQSTGASVDYVCLVQRSGILEMPDCNTTKPVWDPSGSGDPLLIYLFKYIGDMIEWGVCVLLSILTMSFNYAVIRVEDLLLRIGPLPNPFGGNFWEELKLFIQLSFEGLVDYFGHAFLPNLSEWIRELIDQFGRWLSYQGRRILEWLDWLLYDIVLWLSQQFGVPPQAIYDALYDLGYEARMFWLEMQAEVLNEWYNALQLLTNMANVLITIASGVRGVSGTTVAYIGADFTGVGGFIWDGVEFANDAVDMTPLSGLNVVALGVITIGLVGWTGRRFLRMLEAFS